MADDFTWWTSSPTRPRRDPRVKVSSAGHTLIEDVRPGRGHRAPARPRPRRRGSDSVDRQLAARTLTRRTPAEWALLADGRPAARTREQQAWNDIRDAAVRGVATGHPWWPARTMGEAMDLAGSGRHAMVVTGTVATTVDPPRPWWRFEWLR